MQMAQIVTKVVTHEFQNFKLSGDGSQSVGEAVNAAVDMALREGKLIEEVAFQVDQEEWSNLLREFHGAVTAKTKR
jgi:hypothetical protein